MTETDVEMSRSSEITRTILDRCDWYDVAGSYMKIFVIFVTALATVASIASFVIASVTAAGAPTARVFRIVFLFTAVICAAGILTGIEIGAFAGLAARPGRSANDGAHVRFRDLHQGGGEPPPDFIGDVTVKGPDGAELKVQPCAIRARFFGPLSETYRDLFISGGTVGSLTRKYMADAAEIGFVVDLQHLEIRYFERPGQMAVVRPPVIDRLPLAAAEDAKWQSWLAMMDRVQALPVPDPTDVATSLRSDFICGDGRAAGAGIATERSR